MFGLGWAVGKRSTPLDDYFQGFSHGPARWLLLFTDPWILALVLAAGVALALYRQRWRLAAVMVASPLAGIVVETVLKHVFGRKSGGSLAYPSGHTTAAVIVMGMIVLVAGAALWAVLVAIVVSALAMIGQGVTYHYFTDTVGGLLLGTAVVCLAALAAKLDTRQPACDADHTAR
jgi:membrane-associated phospholipid phosphatase